MRCIIVYIRWLPNLSIPNWNKFLKNRVELLFNFKRRYVPLKSIIVSNTYHIALIVERSLMISFFYTNSVPFPVITLFIIAGVFFTYFAASYIGIYWVTLVFTDMKVEMNSQAAFWSLFAYYMVRIRSVSWHLISVTNSPIIARVSSRHIRKCILLAHRILHWNYLPGYCRCKSTFSSKTWRLTQIFHAASCDFFCGRWCQKNSLAAAHERRDYGQEKNCSQSKLP